MGQKFSIEEIKKYLLSQDSMGDILYNLSEKNLIRANTFDEDEDESCIDEFDDGCDHD